MVVIVAWNRIKRKYLFFIYFFKTQESQVEFFPFQCFSMLTLSLQFFYIELRTETLKNCNSLSSTSGSISLPEELLGTDICLQAHEEKPAVQANKKRLRQKGEDSTLLLILILDFKSNTAYIHLDVLPSKACCEINGDCLVVLF